ncbi:MAG: pyridoxamine 5'-phosphate oxidase family protein [Parvibaculaceae bacterium]|nr:pyridoxamine 5'-phosphate oxidase family protein [Parvibaculaceae bacterium]
MDNARAVRRILHEAGEGALGTLFPDGAPYVSLVTVATSPDGMPTFLLSRLALHTRNLHADPRASLLLRGSDAASPLEGTRVSLPGLIEPVDDPAIRQRFLARHPDATLFCDFADFGFYRLVPTSAHIISGFGRIADIEASAFLGATGG